MRGNSAILKCSIPSFVADFVHVVGWIDEEGHEYFPSTEGNFSGGKNCREFSMKILFSKTFFIGFVSMTIIC